MNIMRYPWLYVVAASMMYMRTLLPSELKAKHQDSKITHGALINRPALTQLFTDVCKFSPKLHNIIFNMLSPGLCPVAKIKHGDTCIRALTMLDHERFASLDEHTIKIWNIKSVACIKTLTLNAPHLACALIALSPGRILTHSGTLKHRMVVYDVLAGSCRKISPSVEIMSLITLSDDRIAFSRLGTTSIKICNVVTQKAPWRWSSPCTMKQVLKLKGHNEQVTSLEALPNHLLASGSDDWAIKIWNTENGVCMQTLRDHITGVQACRLLSTSTLVSYDDNNVIKLWNFADGKFLKTIATLYNSQKYNRTRYGFQSVAHKYLVVSCQRHIRVFDPVTEKCLQVLDVNGSIMSNGCRQFVSSDNHLALGLESGDIMLYEMVN